MLFLEKGIYINISASASTNAYGCSLLQAFTKQTRESQKQRLEP
jgi:hypothetical protein